MKLNFNVPIFDLDGNPIPDTNAGKLLANTLVYQPEGEIIKLFDWALILNKGEILDLDRADRKYMTDFIKNSRTLTLLAKKQMLDILDKPNGEIKPNEVV